MNFSALGFDDMIAFKKALRELQNQELSESKELSQNSIRSIIDLVARYELSNITELSNDLNLEALIDLPKTCWQLHVST